MLKSLFTVGSNDPEGLDVGGVDAYIGNNAYRRNKRFLHIKHFRDLPTSSLL